MRLVATRIRRAAAVVLALAALGTAFGAANTVPATKLGQSAQTITANTLKPATCSAIALTTTITGNGTFSGTSAANLVTGSAGVDTITALGGNDCLLGGAGDDSLDGGAGTDVCIGGAGTDTFTSCATQIQ